MGRQYSIAIAENKSLSIADGLHYFHLKGLYGYTIHEVFLCHQRFDDANGIGDSSNKIGDKHGIGEGQRVRDLLT